MALLLVITSTLKVFLISSAGRTADKSPRDFIMMSVFFTLANVLSDPFTSWSSVLRAARIAFVTPASQVLQKLIKSRFLVTSI